MRDSAPRVFESMNTDHFNQRRAGLGTAEVGEHGWLPVFGQPLLQTCPLGALRGGRLPSFNPPETTSPRSN